MRLAVNSHRKQLKMNISALMDKNINPELKTAFEYALNNWDIVDNSAKENADKIVSLLPQALNDACEGCKPYLNKIKELDSYLVEKSVWCFGGDGWAYDIGFGGLDHVMASNRNVNIFVLDTEVYSNTGGQASKSTPIGSVARFAEAGKTTTKKDLGMMMMSYGYVYVASISMGANKVQALKAIEEAENYPGPAIIIAYAPCINHGIDMAMTQKEEKVVVDAGYWMLYRYNPLNKLEGKNPFMLDSKEPTGDLEAFLDSEKRYSSLKAINADKSKEYHAALQKFVKERYEQYKKLAQ
jgi:pyruvate-ferredoxin/flavodoxin oxidoreductase